MTDTYGITIDITDEQARRLEEWRIIFGFESQREMVEHVIFLGELVHEMKLVKELRLTNPEVHNVLFGIGTAFIAGDLRVDNAPQFDADEGLDATLEEWQDYLGFSSKAAFERHLKNVGLMVYALAGRRPLTGEEFAALLAQVVRRLIPAQFRNLSDTVKEYRQWQAQNRRRRRTLRTRRIHTSRS